MLSVIISIHAPTRGATRVSDPRFSNRIIFQSTLPRGERQRSICMTMRNTRFQSTLPRGERRIRDFLNRFLRIFQSTLPRGERPEYIKNDVLVLKISIHAPTRGATFAYFERQKTYAISIHAPTRGATSTSQEREVTTNISIHAPTRGATESVQ
mgnify:CR=1 FL=1